MSTGATLNYNPDDGSIVSYRPGNPQWMRKDEKWFKKRPHRNHRLRKSAKDEWIGEDGDYYTIVKQIKPGFRLRVNFTSSANMNKYAGDDDVLGCAFDTLHAGADIVDFTEIKFEIDRARSGKYQ